MTFSCPKFLADVLDRLAEWNAAADHALAGRLDLHRVGMSGHSFGAQTTQAVSGQSAGIAGLRLSRCPGC
ncbi:MAG: hypothetical protein EA424_11050 [Planctomycetaceae bacterium]|nr:MAG: hypothetical protein EA424_11050 [Planctomycetaceae bacterium]